MSDFREPIADDDREAAMDEEDEFELPPPTIDPLESIEEDVDDLAFEERESAIEAGELEP